MLWASAVQWITLKSPQRTPKDPSLLPWLAYEHKWTDNNKYTCLYHELMINKCYRQRVITVAKFGGTSQILVWLEFWDKIIISELFRISYAGFLLVGLCHLNDLKVAVHLLAKQSISVNTYCWVVCIFEFHAFLKNWTTGGNVTQLQCSWVSHGLIGVCLDKGLGSGLWVWSFWENCSLYPLGLN